MRFSVRDGSYSYPGGPRVLSSVSFSVREGDILAILGPNGAGKTTLLRCMLGFLPWSKGESTLDGIPVGDGAGKSFWKNVGYVPQARSFSLSSTILSLVLLGRSPLLSFFETPKKEDEAIAMECLEKLGIADLRDKRANEVSGGELQLALVAKALAGRPKVLVLDEPESNLDFRNQLTVLSTMEHLASEGYTCIFNTHYPSHALRWGTHALLLEKGGESIFGPASDIVTEQAMEKAFSVKTAIREIETESACFKDVLPLEVTERETEAVSPPPPSLPLLAVLAIVVSDPSRAASVNDLLHQFSPFILGRMGMNERERGMAIITVVMEAPKERIEALTRLLLRSPGLSVKATYQRRTT